MPKKATEKERCCEKCGSKMLKKPDSLMNWVKYPSTYPKYDRQTGEVIDYSGFYFYCPKVKWYNFHDEYFVQS